MLASRVTPRGLALLSGAVLLWLVGRLLGIAELNVVAVSAVAIVAAGAVAVQLGSGSVAVRRALSETHLQPGSPAEVELQLRNTSRLTTSLALVSDEVPPRLADTPRFVVAGLPRDGTVSLRYRLIGRSRGRYSVGPVLVRLRDPFGTTQRLRRYDAVDEVLVYPRTEPLGPPLARGAHRGSGSSDARRLLHSGDEFYTMREYVTGDDLRQVHWPSTAHRDRLMVRQQEQRWQSRATVFCDLRAAVHSGTGPRSTLEHAITAAASVIRHLAERDYHLRLVSDTDAAPARATTTNRADATQDWRTLLRRLAEATPTSLRSLAPALLRLRQRAEGGLLVAVVAPPAGREPLGQDPDVRALLQAGRGFDARTALVVARSSGGDGRAAEFVALLAAAGWRATTIAVGSPLAAAWQAVTSRRRAPAVGDAYRPDSAASPT